MKKILIADVPQMDARYLAALTGWEVAFVRTMAEARQALGRPYEFVAIGVYFDDSRMFDLVRWLRADAMHASVPIVCVRGRQGFTAVSTRTLELTLKTLSADELIDLVQLADDAGNAALRATVARLLKA